MNTISQILDWLVAHWESMGIIFTVLLGLLKRKMDRGKIKDELSKRGIEKTEIDKIV